MRRHESIHLSNARNSRAATLRLRFELAPTFDEDLRRLLQFRAGVGVSGPPDWDAFVAPIDVVIDDENLTETLPPEPVFAFGTALCQLASSLAVAGVGGRVEFHNSPWSLGARPPGRSGMQVTTLGLERGEMFERSYVLGPRELPDAVMAFVSDIAQRVAAACAETGNEAFEHPLSAGILHALTAVERSRQGEAGRGRPLTPAGDLVVETRSSDGYTLQTRFERDDSALCDVTDPTRTGPLALQGHVAWVPDPMPGVVLHGAPLAILARFVRALLRRVDEPDTRDGNLALVADDGSIEWHAADGVLRTHGHSGADWVFAAEPVGAAMAVLEHTVHVIEELRQVDPRVATSRAISTLRDDAEELRRRLALAVPVVRAGAGEAFEPPRIPLLSSADRARGDGEVRHVVAAWSSPWTAAGRQHVDAWPTDHGFLLRVGGTLLLLDPDGDCAWSRPGPPLPSALRHAFAGDQVLSASFQTRDAGAWPDSVVWVDLATGSERLRLQPLNEPIRAIVPIENSGSGAVLGARSVAFVAPDGVVGHVHTPHRRPRFHAAGDLFLMVDVDDVASVACWSGQSLRPEWDWFVEADAIHASVLGDVVFVTAVRGRAAESVNVLLDARTGAVIATATVAGYPVANGTLDDGRPWRALGLRAAHTIVVPSASGTQLEHHSAEHPPRTKEHTACIGLGSRLLLATAQGVEAFDPLQPGRTLWSARLMVDRPAMNAITYRGVPELVPFATADALHWLTPAEGRVLASLPRRDERIVGAFSGPRGDLLCVEHEGGATRVTTARLTRLLRVIRGGRA